MYIIDAVTVLVCLFLSSYIHGIINPQLSIKRHMFDVHVTVHLDKFLTIEPTGCTNFSKFYFGMKLYMFRTVPLSVINGNVICRTDLLTAWKQDQDGTAVSKPV
jgi:hypothetical protein